MKTVLTIAGSDSSGGAGIQADIKTMTMLGCFAMSAITAITAQNTTGVRSVQEIPPDILQDQISAVFEDIPPDAVKIGMVSSPALIEVIAYCMKIFRARSIVLDPVMVATSGAALSSSEAVQKMQSLLFPMAAVITPNIPEAGVLSGREIHSEADMETAAQTLHQRHGCAVLLKGGHNVAAANDVLCTEEGCTWLRSERIDNPNTHGTGCTLSSAIASFLAKGLPLGEAVRQAKAYLNGALSAMLDLGHGSGPLCHNFTIVNGDVK